MRVEAECLTKEIEEVERKRRELEEVELERLMQEKERLEEEKQAEQQCAATLHGSERVAEWRQVVLAVLPPEAGPSRAPQKPEQTAKGADRGPGIVIPEKNCGCCVAWETLCRWDLEGCARSCKLCHQLKKPCLRFEEPTEKGKWRVEDEDEGVGPSKRPSVGPMLERTERRLTEVEDPQVGSRVVEALWALNARLGEIQAELVTSQEAMSESTRLLHRSIVYNLHQIEMMLVVQRDWSWEEGEPEVEGSGEAEESGEWVEERTE